MNKKNQSRIKSVEGIKKVPAPSKKPRASAKAGNSFRPVAVSPRTATRKREELSFRGSPEAETTAGRNMNKKIQWKIKAISDLSEDKKYFKRHLVSGAAKGGLTVLISVLIIFTIVKAGSLTPPASPTVPAATSYTLSDIYTRLTTNATSTAGNHIFSPDSAPAGTLYTLTEIYGAIPTIDPTKLLSDTEYLGITGAIADNGAFSLACGVSNQSVTAGYYSGGTLTGDADLIASNIANGVNVFGVAGSHLASPIYGDDDPAFVLNTSLSNPGTYDPNTCSTTYDTSNLSVGTVKYGTTFGNSLIGDYPSAIYNLPGDTAAGDAAAGNILSGLEAWTKTGSLLTGSMANIGAQTITPSTSNQTITAGYHDGSGYCLGDADLAAGKIKSAENLFGVVGDYPSAIYNLPGDTAAGDAATGNILSGLEAWTKTGSLLTGSMANIGAQTITPAAANTAITQGYHDGAGYCAGDGDLVAANIASNVDIFGVSGTLLKNLFTGTDRSDRLSAVTLNAGGSGYTPGAQVLTVTQSGAGGGTVNVTVDAGGVVTSVNSIATTGKGYSVANGLATTAAAGAGATVNITAVASHYPITVGGVDDYNDSGTMPGDSYASTWTACNAGNSYCDTGDATNADKKDNSTGLVWSIRIGASNWFSANNCKYPNGLLGDDGACGTYGEIACKCEKLPEGSKTGCETLGAVVAGNSGGWRLPSQKELMQAYINGSWSNLSSAGYNFWSATTTSDYTSYAWTTGLTNGYTYSTTKAATSISVRCVR